MNKIIFIIFLVVSPMFLFSQLGNLGNMGGGLGQGGGGANPFSDKKKEGKENIYEIERHKYADSMEVYKIFKLEGDTTFLDTSLSIRSYYKKNQIYSDLFELQPLSNIGTSFGFLTYKKEDFSPVPKMGYFVRDFYYKKSKDVDYYDVRTPISELDYMGAFTEGNILKTLFTANPKHNINFSVLYNGQRSIGNYVGSFSRQNQFISTLRFNSKRYSGNVHYINQNILSDENGGVEDINNFTSGDDRYLTRGNVPMNLNRGVSSFLKGWTFFINHSFHIIKNKDVETSIKHQFSYDTKYFSYTDTYDNKSKKYYDTETIVDKLNVPDSTFFRNMNNDITLETYLFGTKINTGVRINSIEYTFKNVKLFDGKLIENIDKSDNMYFKLDFENNNIPNLTLKGKYIQGFNGDFRESNYLFLKAKYKIKNIDVRGSISNINKYPDFTYQVFQSNYKKFNWNNNFGKLENRKEATFNVDYKKYSLKVDYNSIYNYYYFDENRLPTIYDKTINIFSTKISVPFRFWKFGVENDFLFQNVFSGEEVYRLPSWITRNTFYFEHNWVFLGNKKVAFMQTGLTFNMFSSYKANDYNPLYSNYFLQNNSEVGNFPMVDFFINVKIRTMRIYIKIQRFNGIFSTDYNYFSAPNQPYIDWNIRMGLTWNFFS